MAVKRKYGTLGRGLDALISTEDLRTDGSSTINEIRLDLIDANPNQPRREFDAEALQELADSILEIGIVQPITLRQLSNGRYQIIAGERRWRASQQAHMATIPAYIRTVDDENMMEMALVENIQRQDLNPIEIALAYQHLMEQYGLTQEKLAERVGKKRATVANFLRLLKLPAPVQVALQNRKIDAGHARALLAASSTKQQLKLFHDILRNGYSVRKVEELVQHQALTDKNVTNDDKKSYSFPDEVEVLRSHLSQNLSAPILLKFSSSGKGKLSVEFKDLEDLKRILSSLL